MKRLFALLPLALVLAAAPVASADPPPGEYTWEQAVLLGLPEVHDFDRPPGMPDCPPIQDPYPSVGPNEVIPANAPTCYMPPEEQGLIIVVPAPGDPEFGFGIPSLLSNPVAPDRSNSPTFWPITPLGIGLDRLVAGN